MFPGSQARNYDSTGLLYSSSPAMPSECIWAVRALLVPTIPNSMVFSQEKCHVTLTLLHVDCATQHVLMVCLFLQAVVLLEFSILCKLDHNCLTTWRLSLLMLI